MIELRVVHPPCHRPQASTRAEWGRLVRPSAFPHFLKQCPTPEGRAGWVERSQAFNVRGIYPRGKKGEPQTPRDSLVFKSLSYLNRGVCLLRMQPPASNSTSSGGKSLPLHPCLFGFHSFTHAAGFPLSCYFPEHKSWAWALGHKERLILSAFPVF